MENPEIAKLRTLIADEKFEDAKEHLKNLLTNEPKIIREAVKTENMTTASFILEVLETWEENPMERTRILLAGSENPDEQLRNLVTETFRKTRIHVGLIKEFNPNKINAKEIVRVAAGGAVPFLPKNMADFLEQNPDPLVTRLLIRRLFEGNGTGRIKLTLNFGENFDEAKNMIVRDVLIRRQKQTKIQPLIRGIRAIDANITEEKAEAKAELLSENADFIRACVEKNIPAVKQFLDANALPNDAEDIAKFLKASTFEGFGPEQANQDQILMTLLKLNDSTFFLKYIRILEDPNLNMEEKTKSGIILLQEAILAEEHMKQTMSLTACLQKNAVEQFTGFATSFAEGVKAAQEVIAVVTPVALQKVITGDESAETEEAKKEVDKQVTPEMLSVLRTASETHLENDDSLTVTLENTTVINIKNKDGALHATIPANDGTAFPLESMDMASLEKTIIFSVIPHNISRAIFTGKDQDLAIVSSVFGLDPQDSSLITEEEMERYTQYQRGQSNIRKKALMVFREMGVVDEGMRLNVKRGRIMANLLKYLDLHMGLEYVNEQDLLDIAASWKADGTTKLRTPWEAREILAQKNVA